MFLYSVTSWQDPILINHQLFSFGETSILTDLGKVGRLIQNDKNLYHSQRRNAQRNQFKPVEFTLVPV